MSEAKQYVMTDPHGSMRIGNSRVSLDSIVHGWEQGQSPETIRSQFPVLTLEEVYGAITYYLANRKLVSDYLAQQDVLWRQRLAEQASRADPMWERLQALKASQAAVNHNA